MWLTATYFLHTIGELFLSPVGLSAMTMLAPARIGGLMMGVWFLATSVGNFIGGRVSGLYESIRAAVAVRNGWRLSRSSPASCWCWQRRSMRSSHRRRSSQGQLKSL